MSTPLEQEGGHQGAPHKEKSARRMLGRALICSMHGVHWKQVPGRILLMIPHYVGGSTGELIDSDSEVEPEQ